MFALAIAVVEVGLDGSQADLLDESFQYSSPFQGPLSKKDFLTYTTSYNFKEALPDLNQKCYNLKIDSMEPDRGKQLNMI